MLETNVNTGFQPELVVKLAALTVTAGKTNCRVELLDVSSVPTACFP